MLRLRVSRRRFLAVAGIAVTEGLLDRRDVVARALGMSARWADDPRRASVTFDAAWLASGTLSNLALDGDQLRPTVGGAAGTCLSPIVAAPFSFNTLAVHWTQSAPGAVLVALRVSTDGLRWSGWQNVEPDGATRDPAGPEKFGAVQGLFEPAAGFAQVRLTMWGDETGGPSVSAITLVFMDTSAAPTTADALASAGISATDMAAVAGAAKPPVISRAAWGCPDGQGSPRWAPQYQAVSNLFIHHTATSNGQSNWAAVVRAIWSYHSYDLGWGDIGYNYLVDPNGYLYEGRAGGDDVTAGHTYGFNKGTLGLAFLGTFSTVSPPAAMLASAERLLAWKCAQRGFDPSGTNSYLAYPGCPAETLVIPRLLGHRDAPGHGSYDACNLYGPTSCPGSALAAVLPSIRAAVSALIPSVQVTLNPVTTSKTWFALSWTGSGGTGPLTYSVETSRDGSNWQSWLGATVANVALFVGQPSQSYYFRARASDPAGNVSQPSQILVQTGTDSSGINRAPLLDVGKHR